MSQLQILHQEAPQGEKVDRGVQAVGCVGCVGRQTGEKLGRARWSGWSYDAGAESMEMLRGSDAGT
jgi:hypothetical protein